MTTPEQYPEDQLLSQLLRESTHFRQFYESERRKISDPIAWIRAEGLPAGVNAQAVSDRDQHIHIIGLPRIPVLFEDALMVAEELEHCIYDEEGFPGCSPVDPMYGNLAPVLNSMVGDPIAHSRLGVFGFDFRGNFERENQESRRQLQGRAEPVHRADVFVWMANYASNVLEAQAMGLATNQFQTWFDSAYPHVADKARGLLRRIYRIGFDTPAKQERLLKDVVRRYKLDPFLRIQTRTKRPPLSGRPYVPRPS